MGNRVLTHTKRGLPATLPLVLLSAFFFASCSNDTTDPSEPRIGRVDFSSGQHGWTAGFADYPVGEEASYELKSDYRGLPAPLNRSQNALYISGNNHSDDLFMYWKGKIVGLSPNTTYRTHFELEFATNTPSGCIGVGGSPGESVYVKAGASDIEPEALDMGGFYQMNIDKGNQSTGGENAVVLGDVANSQPCGGAAPQWELKQLASGADAVVVTTDGEGSVWLFMGTDSGFEATTSLYYTWLEVTFEPVS